MLVSTRGQIIKVKTAGSFMQHLKIAIVIATLWAANTGHSATKTWGILRVGVVLPLNGSQARYGMEAKDAIELKLADLKQKSPGVYSNLKVTYIDTKSSYLDLEDRILDIHKKKHFSILIGGLRNYDGEVISATAQKAGIPIILIGSPDLSLASSYKNLFLNNTPYKIRAHQWILKVASIKQSPSSKMWILWNSSEQGVLAELARTMISALAKQKREFVAIDLATADLKNTKITSRDVQVLLTSKLVGSDLDTFNSSVTKTRATLTHGSVCDTILKKLTSKKLRCARRYPHSELSKDHSDFLDQFQGTYARAPSSLAFLAHQAVSVGIQGFIHAESSRQRPFLEKMHSLKFRHLGYPLELSKDRAIEFYYHW